MNQMDRAMRLRQKEDHGHTLRVIAVVAAIISAVAILATQQSIPRQQCHVTTYGQGGISTYGEYNLCNSK